jgi:hypothetical protein
VNYPIKVSMPPAITKGYSGTTYIVAGCMIPVPDGTTREDMHKYVTYEKKEYDVKSWDVKSSSGSTYKVKCYDGKKYTCNCPGFRFHKRCKHVNEVMNEYQKKCA